MHLKMNEHARDTSCERLDSTGDRAGKFAPRKLFRFTIELGLVRVCGGGFNKLKFYKIQHDIDVP